MQGAPPSADKSSQIFEIIKYLEHLPPPPPKNCITLPLVNDLLVPITINSTPEILKKASHDSTCRSLSGNDT